MQNMIRWMMALLLIVVLSACGGGGGGGTTVAPPEAAQNLTAVPASSQVALSWDAVAGADEYLLYWHDNGTTSAWTLLQTQSQTTYTHSGLTLGVTYSYQVVTRQGFLESAPSAAIDATTRLEPAAPPYVWASISHLAADDNPLLLSWPAVADASRYRVYYGTQRGVTTSDPYVETTVPSLSISVADNFGLLDGALFFFRIMPVNIDVPGTFSNEISVGASPRWKVITPGYGSTAINGMAHDSVSGIYLHVGDKGLIARSTDGLTWSVQHSGVFGYNLTDVVWTGTRFVAVGTDGATTNAKAIVLTSSDGIHWQTTYGMLHGTPSSIAWNGSQLLTVGYKMAAYSSDQGETWTPITSMGVGANVSNAYFTHVIWDGSRFVLSELGSIVTTSDLASWSFSSAELFNDIVYSGATYVASGSSGLFTSTDLTSWTLAQAIPAGSPAYFYFYQAIWDSANSQFVAFGVDPYEVDSAALFTSPDGTSWTAVATGLSQHAKGLYHDGSRTWFYGDRGLMLTSTDGYTWSAVEDHAGVNLYGLTAVGANGWAVVGSGATIGISADGDNWSWSTRPCSSWTTGTSWTAIAHDGSSKYLTVGHEGCVMTSDDGVNWVERDSGVAENLSDVIWDGSQFVAIGANGTLLTSANGSPWTQQTVPTTQTLVRLVYAAGTYVAVGNAGTILTSPDAVTWTAQTSPLNSNLRGLSYRNGHFLIGVTSGYVMTSSDAVNWTATQVTSGSGTQMNTVGVTDSGYLGMTLNGTVFSSLDGTTWGQESVPPMGSISRFVINGSGRMMVSGVGGLLIAQ